MFFGDKDNELADARMEQVFIAIKEQNKNALKELFSKKAIEESENIDADIEKLLCFIQGNVVSWNRDETPIVFDSAENGSITKQLITWYYLSTQEQNYLLLLVDYPIDTIDPENVGVYAMRILKEEDENKLTGALEDCVVPGVCIFVE